MNKKDVYIYFSNATDITGNKLVKALEVTGGSEKPTVDKKLVIGWGAKTNETITFSKKTVVLNHPDAIKLNRNKFEATNTMASHFNKTNREHTLQLVLSESIKEKLASGGITLPLIGRTKFHQGGKGFWNCPTSAQLEDAIQNGAHHFQPMLAVKEEYRLHVFKDDVIHATKKVKRTNEDFEKAFIEDELSRQKSLAEKNNDPFDEATAKLILRRQAINATAGGANMLLRSNKMGWKFLIVTKYPKELKEVAVEAVKALKLDFGAVDCCITVENKPYIFEVNSGPGLEATSLERYIEAFNKYIENFEKVEKSPNKVVEKEGALNKLAEDTTIKNSNKKEFMKMQLSRFQELIDATDDPAELEAIERVGRKLIFGGQ